MPAIVHDKGALAGDNSRLTGGQVISRALRAHDIGSVFGLAGTSHAHLLEALEEDGLAIHPSRTENGTVGAADGYARITGRCGVALIIADQGLPNAMAALATAWHACSPVLVIVAWYSGTAGSETEAELDNQQLPLSAPYAKWARTVPELPRLSEYVHAAIKRAMSGRPGPVILQVPSAMMAATIAATDLIDIPPAQVPLPAPQRGQVENAADALARAKRPLIIAGGGAHWSGAGPSLGRFVAETQIPVFGNALGRGLIPEDNRLSYCLHLASPALADADVVVVLGARLKGRLGFGLAPQFRKDCVFIQVDISPEELGRNRHVDIPMAADVATAVDALGDALRERKYQPLAGPPWPRALLEERLAHIGKTGVEPTAPVHPYWLGREVAKRMPRDGILVMDGAQILASVYATLPVAQGPVLDHYPLGSMGSCTPLMVGACAGARELDPDAPRRVVMITGDGAFGYFANEIGSAKAAGFNPIVLVANDSAWGVEWAGHMEKLGRAINTELNPTRFDLIAEAHGCLGIRVEHANELGPALDRAVAATVPSVIDVVIDRNFAFTYRADPLLQMLGRFKPLSESRRITYAGGG